MQEELLYSFYSFWKLLLNRGIAENKRGYETFGLGLIEMSREVSRYLDGKTEKQMFQWKVNELVVTSPVWDDFREYSEIIHLLTGDIIGVNGMHVMSQLRALNNAIKCVISAINRKMLTDELMNADDFSELSKVVWNYTNNDESLPCFLSELIELAYVHQNLLPYCRIASMIAMQNHRGE